MKAMSRQPNVRVKKKAAKRLADARARMYRDLIFESAESVFGRSGYDGATMQDIANEAGVSLKTLYATCGSKQDLYAEIRSERANAFVAAMREAIESAGDDARDQIAAMVECYPTFLHEHEDWLRIHLHSRTPWAARPMDEAVAISWLESRSDFIEVFERGVRQGHFYDDDVEELTVLIQTIMQVHMTRSAERGETDPAALALSIMEHVRRMLFRD